MYLFIYLFIYLYFLSFFEKFDTCKIKAIWLLAKLNTCNFENFQHSQKYTHVRPNSFKTNPCMMHSTNAMLSPLLQNVNANS